MGLNSGLYKLLLVIHLLTVMAGFGTILLMGVWAAIARRRGGAEGLAVAEAAYEVVTKWAEKFVYVVPIVGILMVLASDDAWDFDQTWIWLATLLYLIGLGTAHGILYPNEQRINALMAELAAAPPAPGTAAPPQVAELESRGKRSAAVGMVLHLVLVTIVVLMVWKPGV